MINKSHISKSSYTHAGAMTVPLRTDQPAPGPAKGRRAAVTALSHSSRQALKAARQFDVPMEVHGLLSLLHGLADAALLLDGSGKVRYVNPAYSHLTGISLLEATGWGFEDFLTPDNSPETWTEIRTAFTQFHEARTECGLANRGGIPLPCELSLSPLSGVEGLSKGMIALARDLSSQRDVLAMQAEQKLTAMPIGFHGLLGLVNCLAEPALLLDGGATIRYVNPAYTRMTGAAWDELAGRGLEELLIGVNPPAVSERLRAGFSEFREVRVELDLPMAGGRAKPCELSLSPLAEIEGMAQGMLAVIRDLSTQRRTLTLLAEERDKYLSILETGPMGVMALDSVDNGITIADARRPDFPIIYVNAAFERLTGYSAEEALGRHIGLLQGSERGHSSLKEIERALAERREFRLEMQSQRKDGGFFWNEMSMFPIFDGKGSLTHYLGIHSDVSERKSAQIELERLTKELRVHRDDLLSILDQFHFATLIVDGNSRIVFASASTRSVLSMDPSQLYQSYLYEALPISREAARRLRECSRLPSSSRLPVNLDWQDANGEHHWFTCEIKDDPRDPKRRLFAFDDVSEIHRLREQVETISHGDLIGQSEPMRRLNRLISEVSRGDWTVLIEGETGTGKELVARAVHQASARKDRPFVAVNAAGLSESLLASQLFGHKKGAFTGATTDQAGFFEAAEGGTLFLDEIGDLPLQMQASLLRVLQEQEITRLGETRPRKIDVRIIAASHRNLADEVREGRFREDLLFRLRVARLNIPPLRERKTDIPMLAESFLQDSQRFGKSVESFEPAAMRRLMAYHWPGNVRELRSCIGYAVVYSQSSQICLQDLPPELLASGVVGGAPMPLIPEDGDERSRILTALRIAGGNRGKAADNLGISRATFYRRLQQLGMKAEDLTKD